MTLKQSLAIMWTMGIAFALAVYFQKDDSSTQSSLIWVGVLTFITIFALVVTWIKKKTGRY